MRGRRSARGDEDAVKVAGPHGVLVDGHARVGVHGGEHQLGQTLAILSKYATTSASLTSGIDGNTAPAAPRAAPRAEPCPVSVPKPAR